MPWDNDPVAFLIEIGQGQTRKIDPGLVALAFSALENPHISLVSYIEHLDQLALETSHSLIGTDAEAHVEALRGSIHKKFGYEGDSETYNDLQNADLIRVIDRRKGLPVALGIIYMSVCYRLGWEMQGLSFPGHFLVSLNMGTVRMPIDPFEGGRTLSAYDMRVILKRIHGEQAQLTSNYYQAVSDRDVLLRLQNNIKLRRLRMGDLPGALITIEGMLAFSPGANELRYETAMIQISLGNILAAIQQLQAYLDHETVPIRRGKANALLKDLKARLH